MSSSCTKNRNFIEFEFDYFIRLKRDKDKMSIHGYSYWTRREPLVPREQMWANEEAKSIDERRRRYRCRDRFVTLEDIPSWPIYRQGIAQRLRQERREKIEAAHRWIAQQREAYRRRCAQHEAKRQRLEAARERKAARQARRQAKLEEKQQKQVEQEDEANKKNVEEEEGEASKQQQVEQEKVEDEKNVEQQQEGEVVEKKAEEETVEEEKKEDSDDDDDDVDDDDDDDEDVTSSDEESELSSSEEEPVFAELPDPDADEEVEEQAPPPTAHFAPDEEINRIVTMWRGDITHLEIDAIVNAANRSMLGGGGIDGAIHRAAGDDLYNECKQLNGCATGHCKITRGYSLPAKYVIHTVGPIGEHPVALRSCYLNCLRVAVANGVRSLAFCGISTGIYGYPLYEASHIALKTVRRWLEEGDNRTKFDSIIFCVFLDKERLCYEQLIPLYFPLPGAPYELLPMQPGEEREVPPMVEGKDSSSSDDDDSDDDDDDDDSDDEGEAEKGKGKKTAKGAAPVAPPPPTPNAANVDANAANAEAEVSQLASGVEALAIAPSAPAEDQTAAAPAANDATSTTTTGSEDASTDATPAQ